MEERAFPQGKHLGTDVSRGAHPCKAGNDQREEGDAHCLLCGGGNDDQDHQAGDGEQDVDEGLDYHVNPAAEVRCNEPENGSGCKADETRGHANSQCQECAGDDDGVKFTPLTVSPKGVLP